MSFSVFFEKLKPFWVPARFTPVDHLMLWLVITWLLYFDLLLPRRGRSVRERQLFGPRLSPPEEIVLVALAAYVVIEVSLTALHYMGLGSALSEAEPFLYMFVGYFLLRGMCCHAGREETVDFIAAIVASQSGAAAGNAAAPSSPAPIATPVPAAAPATPAQSAQPAQSFPLADPTPGSEPASQPH